jgi:hypothetical protein
MPGRRQFCRPFSGAHFGLHYLRTVAACISTSKKHTRGRSQPIMSILRATEFDSVGWTVHLPWAVMHRCRSSMLRCLDSWHAAPGQEWCKDPLLRLLPDRPVTQRPGIMAAEPQRARFLRWPMAPTGGYYQLASSTTTQLLGLHQQDLMGSLWEAKRGRMPLSYLQLPCAATLYFRLSPGR